MCHPSKNSRPHTRRLLNLRLLYPRIHVRCLVTNIFLAGLQWVSNQFIILSSLTLLKWLVRYHDYVGNENVKHNRVLWDKQQLCTCIALFCTFLRRHCTTTTWKYLISRLSLKQGDFCFFSDVFEVVAVVVAIGVPNKNGCGYICWCPNQSWGS